MKYEIKVSERTLALLHIGLIRELNDARIRYTESTVWEYLKSIEPYKHALVEMSMGRVLEE